MSRSEGRFLTELRRSSASGYHGKRSSDRYNVNRKVIEEELSMSILDIRPPDYLDEIPEPTAEDLAKAEEDYWDLVHDDPETNPHYYSDPEAYNRYQMGYDDSYELGLDDYYDKW